MVGLRKWQFSFQKCTKQAMGVAGLTECWREEKRRMVNLYLQQYSQTRGQISEGQIPWPALLILSHFLLYSFLCVFQQMYLTCFKTKILVYCCLIGSDICFQNHLGYERQMSSVATWVWDWTNWVVRLDQCAVSGLSRAYTLHAGMGAAITWHVKRHKAFFFFFAKIPPPNKLQPQQGSDWLPSIGQKSCQSSQGVRRVVKTQSRTQWDSFPSSLPPHSR